MRPTDAERQRAFLIGGIAAAIATLAVWFAGLAFLRWVPTRDVNTGLGPDFLCIVVLPLAMAGLAWLAGSAAWREQLNSVRDDAVAETTPSRRDARQRAGLVAPLVALMVDWLVWDASLDRYDWLSVFTIDPLNPSTLVVLIVFPLLLVGVTLWSGLAAAALLMPPSSGREERTETAFDPVDDERS